MNGQVLLYWANIIYYCILYISTVVLDMKHCITVRKLINAPSPCEVIIGGVGLFVILPALYYHFIFPQSSPNTRIHGYSGCGFLLLRKLPYRNVRYLFIHSFIFFGGGVNFGHFNFKSWIAAINRVTLWTGGRKKSLLSMSTATCDIIGWYWYMLS